MGVRLLHGLCKLQMQRSIQAYIAKFSNATTQPRDALARHPKLGSCCILGLNVSCKDRPSSAYAFV